MLYEGKPDFQRILTVNGGEKLMGAYGQNDTYYQFPLPTVSILENPDLDFQLQVIRSKDSTNDIYGRLGFTTQFSYRTTYPNFRQTHATASLLAIPFSPFKLGFSPPEGYTSKLNQAHYQPNWYSADFANYLILLDQQTTALLETTIKDNVVGFAARLDAYIEGVSPRLNYTVNFDVGAVIKVLGNTIKVGEAYDYYTTQEAFYARFSQLPLTFSNPVKEEDQLLVSQAILDRIFNAYGVLYAGAATNNRALVQLNLPAGASRLIAKLDEVVLSKRPLVFQFDPFAAAQELAKTSPDKVIFRYEPPAIPAGKVEVTILSVLPQGMQDINLLLQLTVAGGPFVPKDQQQAVQLTAQMESKSCFFTKPGFDPHLQYTYQLQINYLTTDGYKSINGSAQQSEAQQLVINQKTLPCSFLTFSISSGLATIATLEGILHTRQQKQPFTLTKATPNYSYPVLSEGSYATVKVTALADGKQVTLPSRLLQSTTIGQYNFPGFGNQTATITAVLGPKVTYQTVLFEAEGRSKTTSFTFIEGNLTYQYHWTPYSIFKNGFRYKIGDGQWSDYVHGNQTITIN